MSSMKAGDRPIKIVTEVSEGKVRIFVKGEKEAFLTMEEEVGLSFADEIIEKIDRVRRLRERVESWRRDALCPPTGVDADALR